MKSHLTKIATKIEAINSLQPAFKPVLIQTAQSLKETLGSNLHSIYVYGSVSRGEARPFESDLDISFIVHQRLDEATKLKCHSLENALAQEWPIVRSVEFDIGTWEEAMVRNEYEWQFWLANFCLHIEGENLQRFVSDTEPNTQTLLKINSDFIQRVSNERHLLAEDSASLKRSSIAKKLIRTHYGIKLVKTFGWVDSVSVMLNRLVGEHEIETVLADTLLLLSNPSLETKHINEELVQSYVDRLLENFETSWRANFNSSPPSR